MVQQQTYPRDRIEWIVYDDGQEPVGDLLEAERENLPTLRYIFSDEKMTLGEKRNRLNEEAQGSIIVAMDDDDYYFPQRLAKAVEALIKNPTIDLAGSSLVYMYFADTKEVFSIGPYFPKHATNGTMAWTKRYAMSHRYDEAVAFAEEKSFLEEYKNPLIQLDCMDVMLVISHLDNTFDKTQLRNNTNPLIKKLSKKLSDFIKDPVLLQAFSSI